MKKTTQWNAVLILTYFALNYSAFAMAGIFGRGLDPSFGSSGVVDANFPMDSNVGIAKVVPLQGDDLKRQKSDFQMICNFSSTNIRKFMN